MFQPGRRQRQALVEIPKARANSARHQLICTRYEANRSLIITTNRPYGEWDKTFANDNAIASAITDRLVHRSRTFILTGESRRLHEHQSA